MPAPPPSDKTLLHGWTFGAMGALAAIAFLLTYCVYLEDTIGLTLFHERLTSFDWPDGYLRRGAGVTFAVTCFSMFHWFHVSRDLMRVLPWAVATTFVLYALLFYALPYAAGHVELSAEPLIWGGVAAVSLGVGARLLRRPGAS